MNCRSLSRRLERLEAELMPGDEQVLRFTVSRIGKPVKIIELRLPEPTRRRRRWHDRRDNFSVERRAR
jgi:hypothetical protein